MSLKITSENKPEIPSFLRNLYFLIADDEEFNLFILKKILNKWGVLFEEAHNGKETVKLALMHSFDLILIDLRMPVMDGNEAAKKIIQHCPSAKIIALTAAKNREDLNEQNHKGISLFLQKPFTETELFEAVKSCLPIENLKKTENIHYDLSDLKNMTAGDEAFFEEMLKIFITSSENGLKMIQERFKTSNWDEISEAAHKLAAPAKHIDYKLYNNLKLLETIAQEGKDISEITRVISIIEVEIFQINNFIKHTLLKN